MSHHTEVQRTMPGMWKMLSKCFLKRKVSLNTEVAKVCCFCICFEIDSIFITETQAFIQQNIYFVLNIVLTIKVYTSLCLVFIHLVEAHIKKVYPNFPRMYVYFT